MATAARLLAGDPALQTRLRTSPELVDPFLDECLRLEPPYRGHYRHALTDTRLGGVEVRAGSNLLLLWGAANRDPARFERPDELELDRPGISRCPGPPRTDDVLHAGRRRRGGVGAEHLRPPARAAAPGAGAPGVS